MFTVKTAGQFGGLQCSILHLAKLFVLHQATFAWASYIAVAHCLDAVSNLSHNEWQVGAGSGGWHREVLHVPGGPPE